MISHECRIPYPEEAEQDGDVPPQGRVEEVLVDVVRPVEQTSRDVVRVVHS